MGEVIDLTTYKEMTSCTCSNCCNTNPEQTLGFFVCLCPASEHKNELVDGDFCCSCYERKSI